MVVAALGRRLIAIRTEIEIDAPLDVVWADLADIASHVEWMVDAVAIDWTSPGELGVGTTFDVDTRLGPIRLTDPLEITDWEPYSTLAVRHGGAVTGTGRFTLEAISEDRTRVTRDEHLRFPWWMGGAAGEIVATPILRALFRANLRAFAARHAT